MHGLNIGDPPGNTVGSELGDGHLARVDTDDVRPPDGKEQGRSAETTTDIEKALACNFAEVGKGRSEDRVSV
jgi:hypothetical protein